MFLSLRYTLRFGAARCFGTHLVGWDLAQQKEKRRNCFETKYCTVCLYLKDEEKRKEPEKNQHVRVATLRFWLS